MSNYQLDEEGFTVCPKCNGAKRDNQSIAILSVYVDEDTLIDLGLYLYCYHCKGFGKIDWINLARNEPRYDEVEDYNKDWNKICDIVAAMKLNMFLETPNNYNEAVVAINTKIYKKENRLDVLDIFDEEIDGIFNLSAEDLIREGFIPEVSQYMYLYIIDCIEYTASMIFLDYLYTNILEEKCICVNKNQIEHAIRICEIMLGIESGNENYTDDSLNDFISDCIEIIESGCNDEEELNHYKNIQKAFSNVKLYLTDSDIKSNKLLTI